jgi:HK97 family phage major capsid protein
MPVNIIDRSGTQALMPEEVSREILQGMVQQSSIMQLATRAPNMSRKQRRLPVLSVLPEAYFVDGDTGMKSTTKQNWANKYLDAEELAVIVPISEAVLDDADYDIWGEVRPRIEEAIGKTFDRAILFGENAPSAWPDDILTAATSASHTVDLSSIVGGGGDLYDAVIGVGGTIALIEEDGFMASGHVAAMSMRAQLRGLREKVWNGSTAVPGGIPLFHRSADRQDIQGASRYELDGEPVFFPRNGSMDPAQALMFTGDWSQLVWAVRQDVTYKILTEAVIQDGAGNIVYNLAQQDMVALRAVFRVAWQVPNPINRVNDNASTRYPFSVLVP